MWVIEFVYAVHKLSVEKECFHLKEKNEYEHNK